MRTRSWTVGWSGARTPGGAPSTSRGRALLAAAVTFVALLTGCAAAPSPTPANPTPANPTPASPTPTAEPTTGSATTGDGGAATDPADPADEPDAEPAAAPGTTITSGESAFGTILFDGSQQAIYIWELETTPEARCYGDCADAWPPVLTDGAPVASGAVSAGMLGTTTRTDGTTQVTYNGHPLYYYAHEAPGEVLCHDVRTHGGLWWVVRPDGDRAA